MIKLSPLLLIASIIVGCQSSNSAPNKEIPSQSSTYFKGFGVTISSNQDTTLLSIRQPLVEFQKSIDKDSSLILDLRDKRVDQFYNLTPIVRVEYDKNGVFDKAIFYLYSPFLMVSDSMAQELLVKQFGNPIGNGTWMEERYKHTSTRWITKDSAFILYDKGRLEAKDAYEALTIEIIGYQLNKSDLKKRYGTVMKK